MIDRTSTCDAPPVTTTAAPAFDCQDCAEGEPHLGCSVKLRACVCVNMTLVPVSNVKLPECVEPAQHPRCKGELKSCNGNGECVRSATQPFSAARPGVKCECKAGVAPACEVRATLPKGDGGPTTRVSGVTRPAMTGLDSGMLAMIIIFAVICCAMVLLCFGVICILRKPPPTASKKNKKTKGAKASSTRSNRSRSGTARARSRAPTGQRSRGATAIAFEEQPLQEEFLEEEEEGMPLRPVDHIPDAGYKCPFPGCGQVYLTEEDVRMHQELRGHQVMSERPLAATYGNSAWARMRTIQTETRRQEGNYGDLRLMSPAESRIAPSIMGPRQGW